MENSAQGLSMLEPEHKVVVTGEEHHQADLARWAPRADGRPRRVAAELGFVTGPRGRRVIEVRVDGRRVGILTVLMSERYAPHVFDVQRRGGRPGCVAMVVHGRRGLVEVQVYLPEVARDGTAVLPPAPLPLPVPARPGGRPGPGGSGPAPAPGGPGGRGPAPAGARRSRKPLWIVGGVVLLVAVGIGVGGGPDDSTEVGTRPAAVPVVALPPTTAAGTTAPRAAAATSRATAAPDPDRDSAGDPARVAPAETRRPAPAPEPTRTTARAPEPEPGPEPEPAEVYYANCDAVRAAGAAPIRVGEPGYRSALDRDGDGQGCGAD